MGLLSCAQDINAAVFQLRKRLSTVTKETLLGVMSMYGCGSMTVKQYNFVCNLVSVANSDFVLPSASSLRRVKWPFFISNIFPKSFIIKLQRKKKHIVPANVVQSSRRKRNSDASVQTKASVVVIPVSKWTKYDLSNTVLHQDLQHSQKVTPPHPSCGQARERCIEHSRLCTNAEDVSCEQDQLFIADGAKIRTARRDDHIVFKSTSATGSVIPSCFHDLSIEESSSRISGKVSFMFTAGELSNNYPDNSSASANFVSNKSDLTDQEHLFLLYLKRCSRLQSTTSPDNRDTVFVLKPGDICTVIIPARHSGSNQIMVFGVLVSRIWRTVQDRTSQLFYSIDCDLRDPRKASFNISF